MHFGNTPAFLPQPPAQILLINFLYGVSQLTIPYDKVDAGWVARPRKWDTAMILVLTRSGGQFR